MQKINDGGPAFPLQGQSFRDTQSGGGLYVTPYQGMTLRDYFAAKAMQGFCARPPEEFADMRMVAELAYELADSMLATREQTEE